MNCGLCGKAVDGTRAYRRVSGWVKGRIQGGTNAVRLMEEEGGRAHRECVDLASAGIHPEQGRLA